MCISLNHSILRKSIWLWIFFAFALSITSYAQNTDRYKKLFFKTGELSSEGFLKDGKPNGYWKTYYKNGNIKTSGNRKEFELDGIWKFYSEEGKLESEITYEHNIKQGLSREYDEEENLIVLKRFKNDSLNGEYVSFFPEGKMKDLTSYVKNKKEGRGFEYAATDGRVIVLKEYKDDFLIYSENINKYNTQGKETEKWIYFHDNGQEHLIGNYENGLKNGVWMEYDINGKLINMLNYTNGVLSTESSVLDVLQTKYTYYPNGMRKTITYARNDTLHGYSKNYKENGELEGVSFYQNGILVAQGGTLDKLGRKQGHWKFFYDTGKLKEEGDFIGGQRNKKWVFYYEDGKRIEQTGEFINDKFSGTWEWFYENGKKRRVEFFEDGLEEGELQEWDKFGYKMVVAEFIGGVLDGNYNYSVGDFIEKGKYRDGLKFGKWKQWFTDYEIEILQAELQYSDGFKNGTQVFYYPNGLTKALIEYKNGELSGETTFFDSSGNLIFKEVYKNGELEKYNGVVFKLPL